MNLPEPRSCAVCGHRPWASDSFCSACGSRLDLAAPRSGDESALSDPSDEHIVELESVELASAGSVAAPRGESQPPSNGRWRQIGGVVVVLVALLTGWRMFASSGDPATGTESADSTTSAAMASAKATATAAAPTPAPTTDEGDPTDPFEGKLGWAPSPATEPANGFWPEPRHLREGLTPGVTVRDDNPPERQAALAALYAPAPVNSLNAGVGSLAVDITSGPVLVDLTSGDVTALAGRDQLLPVGALALSETGIVMRFADPITFGGVNEAAGVVLPWGGAPPIELIALGWQTADRAGQYLLSFSGSPGQARYLLSDLAAGRTVSTGLRVNGPAARVTAAGEVVLAAGAEIIAAAVDVDADDPEAPDVTYRTVARGELLEATGGFISIDCDQYPACRLQLYDDRLAPRAAQRIDGSTLPIESVGPIVVAPDGSGYARWVRSDNRSFDLVVVGGTDDRALPDLPVVFRNLIEGVAVPSGTEVQWSPNGNGLFFLNPSDRTLRYLSLLSERVIELDLPAIDDVLVVAEGELNVDD